MASQQIDLYSTATPATGDTLLGIDVSDTTDSANGTVKLFAFTNFQVRDATLTALAAFNTNGVVVQTAADTFVGRTLTGTANRLTITNGDGVAGAPTFDIDSAYVGQATITTLGTIVTGTWSATAIAVNKGGTNLTSYAIGDLLYASGATTLAKLADVATGNVLISGGVTTAPSWGKVDVTAHISGIVPSANGGTGVNNAGTFTNASNTTITGGGTIALGGFTATIPATLTVAGLAIANVFTASQEIDKNSIAATSTDGVTLANATAAAAGVQQWSPRIRLTGQGWKTTATAASQTVDWVIENKPIQGSAAPQSQLIFSSQVASGGYTAQITFDNSNVALSTGTVLNIGTQPKTGLGIGGGNQGQLSLYADSVEMIRLITPNVNIAGAAALRWNNGSFGAFDLGLYRNAASVLEVNNATNGQWAPILAGVRDSGTTTVVNGLTLGHQSSGTPAAGLGIGVLFNVNSTTTADQNAMQVTAEWVVATHASRTARGKIQVYDTAAREALRVEASGSAAMIGFLGANAVIRQTGGADVTNNVTSGGTSDTIANFTDLTVYANDSAAIRNDIYQLARLVKQDHDALRLLGLLT